MGERGNIIIKDRSKRIYFYTHWKGYLLPQIVQDALARKVRWEDPAYLSRIIFCELIKGQEQEETGFGIAFEPCDNEYPFVIVDLVNKKVSIISETKYEIGIVGKQYSYEEYLKLSKEDLEKLRENEEKTEALT